MMLAMMWTDGVDLQGKTGVSMQEAAWNSLSPADRQTGDIAVEGARTSDAKDTIVAKAEDALAALYDMEVYRFEITPRWIPGSLQKVPADAIIRVEPEGQVERYTNFEVRYTDGGSHQTASVQLMIETERKLPVAASRIMGGGVLEPGDLRTEWVALANNHGQLVENREYVKGKTLRRTLAAGQPIRYADITSEYIVEAGDRVRLIYEQNGLRIELEGEARQSGAQDEEITVYNKETRKRYSGKISSPGVVLWTKTH
ncbi:MAG: flagellar basal body P-ring formation chaperone FlgA [Balneolaceae bacterium]